MYRALTKPPRLQVGDTVATVSLSWGGAGDDAIRWRYEQGKERLESIFGLRVREMPHTLADPEYVASNPQARADDLMQAFADSEIKAIIACIGGEDSIRMLPYIDFDIIRNNPKIFMGYSDSTITHYMCFAAGLSSVYGPAVLTDFAENVAMPQYTVDNLRRTLFSTEPIGEIKTSEQWTAQRLEWSDEGTRNTAREFQKNTGYMKINGKGRAKGHLIGGCADVMEFIKGTKLFPPLEAFDGAILFLETSEAMVAPYNLRWWLYNYAAMGVLDRISGMIWGKPQNGQYINEYADEIRSVLYQYGHADMPVLGNASFGHNEPKCCMPIGAEAVIDCDTLTFEITESAVK